MESSSFFPPQFSAFILVTILFEYGAHRKQMRASIPLFNEMSEFYVILGQFRKPQRGLYFGGFNISWIMAIMALQISQLDWI